MILHGLQTGTNVDSNLRQMDSQSAALITRLQLSEIFNNNMLILCDSINKYHNLNFYLPVEVCEHLNPPANGKLNTTTAIYGTVVLVSCNNGYVFQNNLTFVITTCQYDRNWTVSYGDCYRKIMCII